jgi:hypothetical protein
MALREMDRRRPFGKEVEGSFRDHGSLIEGHLKSPSKFDEGDVFAVAHGAMYVARSWGVLYCFISNILTFFPLG